MEESFSEIIENFFKKLLPLLSAIILMLLAYIPVHLPLSPFLRPDIGVICVFFWSLYRQDLFNVFSAFFLGVIADSMSAVPLGLNIFIYLFIFVVCSIFGRYINMKPFIINWIGFASISAMAIGLKWLLASVYYSQFLPVTETIAGYAATVFLYPLFARLNMYIQNRFLLDEEAVYEQG